MASDSGTDNPAEESASVMRFFGDDATDGVATPDLLDRIGYAEQVIALIDRVREQSRSSVLALIGPWGAGKSSVLQMTLRLLHESTTSATNWLVAEFNPWNYPDLDSLQTGFFAELRSAMPDDVRWCESRKKIGDIGKAISPLGKLTSLVGVDSSVVFDKLSSLIAGDVSLSHTHREAEKALGTLNQPILMVLDDLDRLTPEELLRTLKLVRLVGRLPNVYYLLCYDERTLLEVLQRTELVGAAEGGRARDYMEKIVQVRLDIPPLRSTQASDLFDRAYPRSWHVMG
jgi:predicted KAP-like P-loop ATPase